MIVALYLLATMKMYQLQYPKCCKLVEKHIEQV